jgi:hypothetical protein
MEEKRNDLYSILGFVFGLISFIIMNFIFSILGIVFSSIAKGNNSNDKLAKIGFGLSIASLIISIIFTLIMALLIIMRFVGIPLI